jgi:RimJ/RimL family protein N-acetyltransferase
MAKMSYTPVYWTKPYDALYELLKERKASSNISHKEMPTFEQHCSYVESRPHKEWYLIYADGQVAGQVYVTEKNEIGIQIFSAFHRRGYATEAVRNLIKNHKKGEQLLANINPKNKASIAFFKKLGFKIVQHTYGLAT